MVPPPRSGPETRTEGQIRKARGDIRVVRSERLLADPQGAHDKEVPLPHSDPSFEYRRQIAEADGDQGGPVRMLSHGPTGERL